MADKKNNGIVDDTYVDEKNKAYHQREAKLASTSKYIQTKVEGKTGDIKGIPDQNIIKPNLSKDTAKTFVIGKAGGALSSILGALGLSSLMKNKDDKEIKEVAPDFAKSEYGKIQVKETKGGFVEIFDQTPGNQRTMRLHPAGTYNQVLPNGLVQDKIVNDKVTMIDKNWNITVGEDFVEVVSGNNKIHIKKEHQLNINGNSHTHIDKDENILVEQDRNIEVKQTFNEKVGKGKNIDITKDLTEKVSDNIKREVGKNVDTKIGKNENRTIGGALNVIVTGNIMISSSATMNIISTGPCNVNSSALVKVTAPLIKLN